MSTISRLTELLACPRCDKAPLTEKAAGYFCSACDVQFPNIGTLPWMFAEPEASLAQWRSRLHFELQRLSHELQKIDTELDDLELLSLSRQRLENQKTATQEHRDSLRELLAPVDVQSMSGSYESYLALRTRLPTDQGLHTYYANVHRDWAWGDAENQASLNQIQTVANASGDDNLGDTLILGAGAGRLAYDVHMQMKTDRTCVVDFNPLLMLIANTVANGDPLEMIEFPIAPKSLDDFAVKRTLSAPEAVRDDFYLILGDVLRAPFAAGSFDTVITPWLVDIVSEDFAIFSKRINALLKAGGRWINFGSLAFDHPQRSRCYSPEEALEIVTSNGFDTPVTHEDTIPYMCSPASRHGRQETVFSFAAVKSSNIKTPARHIALPDWIVTGKEAVPALQSFRTQAMTTQIYAFIMSLVDGKRTIKDMAKVLEQQQLMSRDEAEPAIRNFLTRMYDDAERKSEF